MRRALILVVVMGLAACFGPSAPLPEGARKLPATKTHWLMNAVPGGSWTSFELDVEYPAEGVLELYEDWAAAHGWTEIEWEDSGGRQWRFTDDEDPLARYVNVEPPIVTDSLAAAWHDAAAACFRLLVYYPRTQGSERPSTLRGEIYFIPVGHEHE